MEQVVFEEQSIPALVLAVVIKVCSACVETVINAAVEPGRALVGGLCVFEQLVAIEVIFIFVYHVIFKLCREYSELRGLHGVERKQYVVYIAELVPVFGIGNIGYERIVCKAAHCSFEAAERRVVFGGLLVYKLFIPLLHIGVIVCVYRLFEFGFVKVVVVEKHLLFQKVFVLGLNIAEAHYVGDVLVLRYKVVGIEHLYKVVIRTPSGIGRGALYVVVFIYAAVAEKIIVVTGIYAVIEVAAFIYGIVIVELGIHARGQSCRRSFVVGIHVEIGLFVAVYRIVERRHYCVLREKNVVYVFGAVILINGSLIIENGFVALSVGFKRVEPFHCSGSIGKFGKRRIFRHIFEGGKRCILNQNGVVYKRIGERCKSLAVSAAVLNQRRTGIEEVSHKFALYNRSAAAYRACIGGKAAV